MSAVLLVLVPILGGGGAVGLFASNFSNPGISGRLVKGKGGGSTLAAITVLARDLDAERVGVTKDGVTVSSSSSSLA